MALSYTLHGDMTQAVVGRDVFGHKVNLPALPTKVDGQERIVVKEVSNRGITLKRAGFVTATVSGRAKKLDGAGWTLISEQGVIVRDKSNLGGLFLLPLAFLGDKAVHDGDELQIGDTWSDRLGTKLFGMTARPSMIYTVSGSRIVLGLSVYTVTATGSVPIKEPVFATAGRPLGSAKGTAQLTMRFDYDRLNRRVLSMELDVKDTLSFTSTSKSGSGTVKDEQRYLVALDAPSIRQSTPVPTDPQE